MDVSTIIPIVIISVVIGLICYIGVLAVNSDLRRPPIRQFSIRDLLFYVFLWAMCLSQIRVEPVGREQFAWSKDWIVVSTWLILAAFYIWKHHRASLVAHNLGVLVYIVPTISFIRGSTKDGLWMSRGMFLGSFTGLACFSIMAIVGMFRRVDPPPEKEEKE